MPKKNKFNPSKAELLELYRKDHPECFQTETSKGCFRISGTDQFDLYVHTKRKRRGEGPGEKTTVLSISAKKLESMQPLEIVEHVFNALNKKQTEIANALITYI